MTSVPPYPAYPNATPPQLTGPLPVEVAAADAAPQRRATVAFRIILVIPHLFVLYFLQIAALVVAFIGWWGALFTGRLPEFAASYLSGYIRWYMRVSAYMFLLTDVYPPFTIDEDPTYPVRIAVAQGQPLNRLAVLFRWILIIPAQIVTSVVVMGAGTIVSFIAWLITLITGQLPVSLHLAFTAVLRYLTRFYCYWFMLTATYPGGLFGDASAYGVTPGAPAPGGYGVTPGAPAPGGYGATPGYPASPGYGTPAGYEAPGYETPGYGTPESVYGAPGGYGSPGGYGAPGSYGVPGAARPVFQPASWQLLLTSAARRLVVLFLVLGALFWVAYGVGYGALVGTAINHANSINTANNAIDQVNSSYNTLNSNLNQWQSAVTACDKNLTCITRADGKAATYFSTFANDLQATPMPSGATAAAAQLHSDATQAARDFTRLSQATTVAQYQNTFTSSGLRATLNRFDQDYNTLGTTLESS